MMSEEITNEDLVQQIRSRGDPTGELRLELLRRNQGFIRGVWRSYSAIIPESDLEGIAFIAVNEACHTFDPEKGVNFLQCLSWALRSELSTTVQQNSNIRLSSAIQRDLRLYSRIIRNFTTDHGKAPSRAEILAETGFTESQLAEIEKAYTARFPASLDAPITADQDGSELTLADTVPDTADVSEDVTAKCFADQLAEFFEGILQALPKEEKVFLNLKFYERRSIPEISQTLNKPPTEVRNLQSKIYKDLRKNTQLQGFYGSINVYHMTGLSPFLSWQGSQPERIVIDSIMQRSKHHDD